MDDRIALLGANGNGKSTLAKLLAGRLQPLAGEMRRGPKLQRRLFRPAPDRRTGAERRTPIDHMARALPRATPSQVRAQLARFGLDADRAETPIGNLSGGEKARLLLALATRDAPQLLILDEPTNHLDIDAREALVQGARRFPGRGAADHPRPASGGTGRRPAVAGRRRHGASVRRRPRRLSRPAVGARASGPRNDAGTRRDDRRERAEARAALAPLRRRAKDAEARLARLAAERAAIEARLADPALYAPGRAGEITAANARLAAIARETDAAEAAWLEAEEALAAHYAVSM